jgi:hypothetical protein
LETEKRAKVSAQKCSRAISRVNIELRTNVSGIPPVSIIRVDVVNDRMSLIFDDLTNWYKYQGHTVIQHIDPDDGDRGDP